MVHSPERQPTIQYRTDTTDTAYFGLSHTWGDSLWLPIYAATLHAMGDPPLRDATLAPSVRVMRFTWLRSFHPYVAVRVTESPVGCAAVTTVRNPGPELIIPLDSFGDLSTTVAVPQSMLRRDSTALAMSTCAAIFAHVEAIGVSTGRPHSPGGGIDGARWVFERVDARGYGCLETWSPDSSKAHALWNAGLAFLAAGRARPLNAREIY